MIIDGKKLSDKILKELKIEYDKIIKDKKRCAKLIVIQVGDDYASSIYLKNKQNLCNSMGILNEKLKLKKDITTNELIEIIQKYNEDKLVDGILVQLPLPSHIDEMRVLSSIDERKDVDGINIKNMGKLILNVDGIRPCTAKAVIKILESQNKNIEGSDIVIIGRSNIVGKPLSVMLTNMSATVTLCHTKTKNLKEKIKKADIVISAAGNANLIDKNHDFKKGVFLIDVGINRDENNKICGDISSNILENDNVSYITPVPGGVGPMTVCMLVSNLIEIFKKS